MLSEKQTTRPSQQWVFLILTVGLALAVALSMALAGDAEAKKKKKKTAMVTLTFTGGALTIPDSGTTNPYPSQVNVGIPKLKIGVLDLNVILNGIATTSPRMSM